MNDDRLRELAARKFTIQEICDLSGDPYSSVHRRMKRLGLPVTKGWQRVSAAEWSTVASMLGMGRSYSEIGRTLNRSKGSIAGIVYRMKNGHDAQTAQ